MNLIPESILVNVVISIGLVCLSGLFSGLTLGLMSLDIVGLEILAQSGNHKDRERAKKIMPVRRKGNLLLCCLLIGNTIVNALLAIFLAELTSGILGLILSTCLIVVFGEITPQAVCSRHGLVIGARTILLTKMLIMVLFVLAYPISKILDYVLGKEIGTVYNREELKTLIALHSKDPHAQLASGLTPEDSQIMSAVLDYRDRKVRDVMTSIDKVFMLESNTKLTFESMMEIYKSGYTRIPVYSGSRSNIIGILYSKDLILIDPDDEVEVKAVLAFHGINHAKSILDNTDLKQVLSIFKRSYSHLMIAISPIDRTTATGVITLEDVIEEMINDEIIDESDRFMDNTHRQKLSNREDRPDVAGFMQLFDHKLRKQNQLSKEETVAVCTYLKAMVPEFFGWSDDVLAALVKRSEILEMDFYDDIVMIEVDSEESRSSNRVVYKQGEVCDTFSLVLQGHLEIEAGTEKFTSHIGPWGFLGVNALTHDDYVSDFDAIVCNSCRILQINKKDYKNAQKLKNMRQIFSQKLLGRRNSS